jgi:hypothetical protein
MTLGVRGPIGVLTAGLLLAGCSDGDQSSSAPQADAGASATPGSAASRSATSVADLRFDQPDGPGSGGECAVVRRQPHPADFVYYPVRIRASQPVRLTSVTLADASRVVADGTWIAATSRLPEEGIVRGWPAPPLLLGSRHACWSERQSASGASLRPDRWYTVFVHVVAPADGQPARLGGLTVAYRDADGENSRTWSDHLRFGPGC